MSSSSSSNENAADPIDDRRPLLPYLVLPSGIEDPPRSACASATPTSTLKNSSVLNIPKSTESPTLTSKGSDPNLSRTFNAAENVRETVAKQALPTDRSTSRGNTIDRDLMSTSPENNPSLLDIFDPLVQIPLAPVLPTASALPPTPSFPYPIKLRLKVAPCPEMKAFSELVEEIRNERQGEELSGNEIFYCKRIQQTTSQHIEHTQQLATIYIFHDKSKEPIRLSRVSLQSTAEQILHQLRDITPFDCDQSILKLPSYDEYLRCDDSLADTEYVYNCVYSLKPIQFVLAKKPAFIPHEQPQQPAESITFEQFSLKHQDTYAPPMKQARSLKSLNKTKQTTTLYPMRLLDCRWLEEFREKLTRKLEQIEQCTNRLLNPYSFAIPIDEQIKSIQELITHLKILSGTCSEIQSPTIIDKQRQLRNYAGELRENSSGDNRQQIFLSRLLFEVLLTLMKYIQTYAQAFFIPYEVELTTTDNQAVDVEQCVCSLTASTIAAPRSIIESAELFTVHIDSLYSLPSNINTVRVLARLCYGNEIRAKQMTRLMSFVRHTPQESFSQVHFDQRLSFEGANLCGIQRETLLLFEIYASFVDETDSALSSFTTEVFDGMSMRLIGWCSQTLFDDEHRLITGERYLGVIDTMTASRTGFYSLRNVSDHDCSILTVTFDKRDFFWPDVPARADMHAKDFTEISSDKQDYLSQLLNQRSLLLVDHSLIGTSESSTENRKQSLSTNVLDEATYIRNLTRELSEEERHHLWSYRQYILQKPHALSKLLESRTFWDYPSLVDIYGLLNAVADHRTIDEIESFELLLPAFPDTRVRTFAYRLLLSQTNSHDLLTYLPQLLQMIKFDYEHSSFIVEYLLRQCQKDYHLAHKLYWYLRQLFLTETIHFARYFYAFLALLYVMDEQFHVQLEKEYDLCVDLNRIGSEIKANKSNRGNYLSEQLQGVNKDLFQSGQSSCRLPCRFSFKTNSIDTSACSIFTSYALPMKLVFNSSYSSTEKYQALYKIGDDLRQDQIVLQLMLCMDKIWKSNDFDFRLSLFNVVQTQERCGFIEMITESETMLGIEKLLGTIKGSFGESALYDWLSRHNTTERDLRIAVDNLIHSCAGYCVATYILGIGDRHNENIMVRKSGHLFHIDFGKYLGDTQKFGSFNRDRAPFVFTKQMLYAMSAGGTSNDAMHQFVDLCCSAFITLRQNSSLLLLLLAHLCPSNVPNLNIDAVRFVYERLVPSKNYAESITHFTTLIIDSLQSTWTKVNGFLHKMAQPSSSTNTVASGTVLSFVPSTYSIVHEGKVKVARVVDAEKRLQSPKRYLYKLQVERAETTYHYRTHNEFYEFYERLREQFPSINFDFKPSSATEDRGSAQKRASDFLDYLFGLSSEITESDVVCTFFHTIQRDQQINDAIEKWNDDCYLQQLGSDVPSRIGIQLKYEQSKLFVMIRHASNLPLTNGNEPRPYCKCYLFPDESKATKRKGNIMSSRNPMFNETFTYEMDFAEIQKRTLHVSVWNYIWGVNNHLLSEVDIVLAEVDWSTQRTCYYALTSPNN